MPSSTNPHIASQLRQLIYYHLDCDLPKNALSFAERLRGTEPRSSEGGYLEGLCYIRLGQLSAAYHSTKHYGSRGSHLGCSYIFGQACLGLGRYVEGIAATEKSKHLWIARNNWSTLGWDRFDGEVVLTRLRRQAHGDKEATATRRCSAILLARKAMARS